MQRSCGNSPTSILANMVTRATSHMIMTNLLYICYILHCNTKFMISSKHLMWDYSSHATVITISPYPTNYYPIISYFLIRHTKLSLVISCDYLHFLTFLKRISGPYITYKWGITFEIRVTFLFLGFLSNKHRNNVQVPALPIVGEPVKVKISRNRKAKYWRKRGKLK